MISNGYRIHMLSTSGTILATAPHAAQGAHTTQAQLGSAHTLRLASHTHTHAPHCCTTLLVRPSACPPPRPHGTDPLGTSTPRVLNNSWRGTTSRSGCSQAQRTQPRPSDPTVCASSFGAAAWPAAPSPTAAVHSPRRHHRRLLSTRRRAITDGCCPLTAARTRRRRPARLPW